MYVCVYPNICWGVTRPSKGPKSGGRGSNIFSSFLANLFSFFDGRG